jgi:peptidoglycan/xylan/chitin deacetylase (PgdA/CDA1 family)
MYIPGAKRLERVFRPIRTFFRPGGLILGYHRVADDAWDPLGLCTTPGNFREHLAVIREHFTPVSMATLVSRLLEGKQTTGLAAITFDDGYADFIEHALPELEDAQIPATVFVTTGNAGKPFWWDHLSHSLGHTKPESSPLELKWAGSESRVTVDANASPEAQADLARLLCRELAHIAKGDRVSVLEKLATWSDTQSSVSKMPRSLTESEIRFLVEANGIEIGCDTVSHPFLANLPLDTQREEIEGSRDSLKNLLARISVKGFSYPNGSFSEPTVSLVQRSEFQYACTSQQSVVRKSAHAYRLPRVWSPNLAGPEFRRWLSQWRGGRLRQ